MGARSQRREGIVRARNAAWMLLVTFATTAAGTAGTAGTAAAKPPVTHARIVAPSASPPSPAPSSWAAALPAVTVKNRNTNAQEKLRLYADDGGIDRTALRAFMRVAGSTASLTDGPTGEVAEPLDPRLVQLVFRSAYHFGAKSMVIVSATRKGAHGKHGTGDALDYQLDGVRAPTLAAHLRGYPRVGVGIYTHPKTQYVHVDVREHSYHWIDGSPPGVTWREKLLGDPTQRPRDASYVRSLDLPEAALTSR